MQYGISWDAGWLFNGRRIRAKKGQDAEGITLNGIPSVLRSHEHPRTRNAKVRQKLFNKIRGPPCSGPKANLMYEAQSRDGLRLTVVAEPSVKHVYMSAIGVLPINIGDFFEDLSLLGRTRGRGGGAWIWGNPIGVDTRFSLASVDA